MPHFVSKSCKGERCRMCTWVIDATHKVGEEIPNDDPNKVRHNLTAYVCCEHFVQIFGFGAKQRCYPEPEPKIGNLTF